MILTLDTTHKLYSPQKAEAIAEEMKASDPEWDYIVVHDPKGTGYSFIEIYDEDGEYVAKM